MCVKQNAGRIRRFAPPHDVQRVTLERLGTDSLAITFQLRNDIVWQDGVRTTAHDVARTFELARDVRSAYVDAAALALYAACRGRGLVHDPRRKIGHGIRSALHLSATDHSVSSAAMRRNLFYALGINGVREELEGVPDGDPRGPVATAGRWWLRPSR